MKPITIQSGLSPKSIFKFPFHYPILSKKYYKHVEICLHVQVDDEKAVSIEFALSFHFHISFELFIQLLCLIVTREQSLQNCLRLITINDKTDRQKC